MKILSVGRDPDCNICIDDPTGLISRRHATIRVKPFGRYELIDLSKNGTTVNSVPVTPSTIKKVKRGDSIIFAGVASLDWKEVPNSMRVWKLSALALLGIIIAFVAISIATNLRDNSKLDNEEPVILNGKMETSDQPIANPETSTKEDSQIMETKIEIPKAKDADEKTAKDKKSNGKENKKQKTEESTKEEKQQDQPAFL